MNWMTIAAMAYMAFGLLLMDFMCPWWHPFEKLIGAIIWPISAVIGIVTSIRGASHRDIDVDLLVMELGLIMIAAEAARKEMERAKEVPQAQASVDKASHDEHGRAGQGMPC